MAQKIHSDSTLVILHGDEMAQVAFEKILDLFVKKRLDIKLCEIDLSAETAYAPTARWCRNPSRH